jgi:enoyl-CoA hydratase/carnithine racemase
MNLDTLSVSKEGAVLFAEIAAPPMNILGPELVRDLVSLIKEAEPDEAVKVLVFKSADPDYFIPHVDVTRIKEYRQEAAKLTGEASLALLFRYLSASRLVTIAQIEGRVRAAGSDWAILSDHWLNGSPAFPPPATLRSRTESMLSHLHRPRIFAATPMPLAKQYESLRRKT